MDHDVPKVPRSTNRGERSRGVTQKPSSEGNEHKLQKMGVTAQAQGALPKIRSPPNTKQPQHRVRFANDEQVT